MVFLMAAALAGTASIHVMVDGESLAIHHGDYCSYPRLAGVTTETEGPIKQDAWDSVFDSDVLRRGFTGLVAYDGDVAVGAHPLLSEVDIRLPGPNPQRWVDVLGMCKMFSMEGASLPELLRKVSPRARAVLLRTLTHRAISQTSCGASARPDLLEKTFACADGRCEAFATRLQQVHAQRCD